MQPVGWQGLRTAPLAPPTHPIQHRCRYPAPPFPHCAIVLQQSRPPVHLGLRGSKVPRLGVGSLERGMDAGSRRALGSCPLLLDLCSQNAWCIAMSGVLRAWGGARMQAPIVQPKPAVQHQAQNFGGQVLRCGSSSAAA
eukprot:1156446-Pelagomonas_calceolata.AAC.19